MNKAFIQYMYYFHRKIEMHLLTYTFIGIMSLFICTACLEDVEDTTIPPPTEEYSFDGGMYMPRDPNQGNGAEGYGSGSGSGSGKTDRYINENTKVKKENYGNYKMDQFKKLYQSNSLKLLFSTKNLHRQTLPHRAHHLEWLKLLDIHSIRHSIYIKPQHFVLKLHEK
jgi:hypothetical protein